VAAARLMRARHLPLAGLSATELIAARGRSSERMLADLWELWERRCTDLVSGKGSGAPVCLAEPRNQNVE